MNNFRWTYMRLAFYAIGIATCLYPIFANHYLITLDGPTHLYNAAIYNRLLSGEVFTGSFFQINPEPVPNYSSHLLLAGLLSLFKSVTALKIFHLLFIFLFAGGFYYWNRPKRAATLYVVFPLIFSAVFASGFYNFVVALALLFFTLGYYERAPGGYKKYGLLTVLLLLVYFSHSLAFALTGLCLIAFELHAYVSGKTKSGPFTRRLAFLAATALPCFILAFLFTGTRDSTIHYLTFNQLINDLYTGAALISRSDAATIAKYLFIGTLIVCVLARVKNRFRSTSGNYLLLAAVLTLIVYFTLPDSVGYAGVFSVRYAYLFWILIAAWIVRNPFSSTWKNALVGVLSFLFLGLQLTSQQTHWKELDRDASLLLEASTQIPEHSVVYPVFASNTWNHFHLSNLAGVDRNLLILENNGARNDYFAVKYNQPYEKLLNETPALDIPSTPSVQVHYVLKIGRNDPDFHPRDAVLMKQIREEGTLVYRNDLIELWKRNAFDQRRHLK